MSCCQNVWVQKYLVVIFSGYQKMVVSKCPGVEILGAKMSENPVFAEQPLAEKKHTVGLNIPQTSPIPKE